MAIDTFEELYIEQLKDLYSAENQILEALPKMIAVTTTPQLKQGFETHLKETEGQVKRLEQIFEKLGQKPGGHTCKAMKGLIAEGKETMEAGKPSPVLDAGLIAAAQRIEHYEMAGYGTARTFATQVGDDEAVRLLDETLAEEKATDEKLTQIAESVVNKKAAQAK